MEVQNNKEQVPFEHYLARYRVLDPGEASRRTGAEFDEQAGVFTLCLLPGKAHPVDITFAHRLFNGLARNAFLAELLTNARGAIAFAAPAGDELADKTIIVEITVFDTPGNHLLQLFRGDVQRLGAVFAHYRSSQFAPQLLFAVVAHRQNADSAVQQAGVAGAA